MPAARVSRKSHFIIIASPSLSLYDPCHKTTQDTLNENLFMSDVEFLSISTNQLLYADTVQSDIWGMAEFSLARRQHGAEAITSLIHWNKRKKPAFQLGMYIAHKGAQYIIHLSECITVSCSFCNLIYIDAIIDFIREASELCIHFKCA